MCHEVHVINPSFFEVGSEICPSWTVTFLFLLFYSLLTPTRDRCTYMHLALNDLLEEQTSGSM